MISSVLSSHTTIDKGLAPSYQPFKERYDLDGLVEDIKQHLGQSGGISSDEVDSKYLISLLKKYNSDPTDWISFFHNDTSKNYTRNAIENINHKANIVSYTLLPLQGIQLTSSASSRVEPWKGFAHSRPCRCSLHYEGPGRTIARNRLPYP